MSRFMPILCLVLWTSLAGSAPAHADSTGSAALAAKAEAPAASPKIPATDFRDRGDSGKTENENAPPPAGADRFDRQVMHAILCPAVIAFILFLIWLGLVVGYYVWAIRRYNVNYGLTDEEWKVLHPAMYANDDERAQYERRKAEMMAGSPQVGAFKAGTDPDDAEGPRQGPMGGLFDEPRENPYKNDSFGLPPGTVRGTLALTAMVCVVLIEGVNLFSPVRLENHFEDLFTVFKMVVAFYFGSRALEVMEKKRAEVKKEESRAGVKREQIKADAADSGAGEEEEEEEEEEADETPAPTGTTASAPASPASAAPATAAKPASSELARSILGAVTKHLPESLAKPLSKVLELPAEKPAVIEGFTAVRVPNIMASLSAVPPPAPAVPPAAVGTAGAGAATKPPAPPAPPAAALRDDTPLNQKVLALTAAFETGQAFPDCFGAVAGNFDGMGISYGALQWNLGQGTLQPLLLKAARNHESVMKPIFGNDLFAEILQILAKGKDEQLAWVKKFQITKQNPATGVRRVVLDPKLAEPLRTLGKTPQMIQIQVEEASTRYIKALSNCEQYQLTTERGVALMFDINVQNGLVDKDGAGAAIRHDYEALDPSRPEAEIQEERMKIIATRRSDVVNPQWRADVLSRKMTIATGQGQVHGRKYDLAVFKLGLNPYTA